jgi:hypothetical protein
MSTNAKGSVAAPDNSGNLGRSQAIFVGVGLAIIFGGLWLLYGGSGPYHPDIPLSESEVQAVSGS